MQKEPKQQKSEEIAAARADAIRRAWLDRTRACSAARSLLLQLEGWLQEHTKSLSTAAIRCSRVSAVKNIIANANTRCLAIGADVLARELIAGKALSAIVLEQEKDPMIARFYKSINFMAAAPIL